MGGIKRGVDVSKPWVGLAKAVIGRAITDARLFDVEHSMAAQEEARSGKYRLREPGIPPGHVQDARMFLTTVDRCREWCWLAGLDPEMFVNKLASLVNNQRMREVRQERFGIPTPMNQRGETPEQEDDDEHEEA